MRAAVIVAAVTLVAYVPLGFLLGTPAALAGLLGYVALLALWRPRGLTESLRYLRALR